MVTDIPPLQRDDLDLAYSIKGTYRILDLISEQSSGGLGEYPQPDRRAWLFSLSVWYQSIKLSYPKTRSRHS